VRLGLYACAFHFAVLNASVTFGQTNSEQPVEVVTVCDVLLNPSGFDGKSLAVLGKFAGSDEGSWLLEDRCDREVGAKNGTSSDPSVWLEHQGSCPSIPPPMPQIDQASLRRKLEQIGKSTTLGKHLQYRCEISLSNSSSEKNSKPNCGWLEAADQWVIEYGRVETMSNRKNGFGHLGGAQAQVVVKALSVSIDENGHLKRF